MGIDYDALMLDPIYDRQGIAAQFVSREGISADFVILDKTAGVEIAEGPMLLQAARPAACVRVSELVSNDLDPAKMKNGRLTFSGACWNVEATRPKPKPGSKGEMYLFLQERSND